MGQIAEETEERAPEGITSPVESYATVPGVADESHAPQQGLTVYDGMLFAMVTVWAVNPAAIKWALDYLDPLVFNSLRFALATLVPLGLVFLSGEGLKWHKGDGWKLLALGLMGHGLYQTLFIVGLDATLAGNTALILSINPAFVATFGALLGYERVRGYSWAGVAMTLAGVGLVILGSGQELVLGERLMGDMLIVVVTIMWALYTVLSQGFLKRYSSVQLNALTMPSGALLLLVVASPSLVESAPELPSVPFTAWLVLVLSGLLAISFSYIIWYKGIQKLGATRAVVYTNLVPVLAAFVSYFWLNEPLGWLFWVGMLIVLAGVTLARFGGRLFGRGR